MRRLPATFYLALSYSNDPDSVVRAILGDIQFSDGDGGGGGSVIQTTRERPFASRGGPVELPRDPRGFQARQDINGNNWGDGGNDAFDGGADSIPARRRLDESLRRRAGYQKLQRGRF